MIETTSKFKKWADDHAEELEYLKLCSEKYTSNLCFCDDNWDDENEKVWDMFHEKYPHSPDNRNIIEKVVYGLYTEITYYFDLFICKVWGHNIKYEADKCQKGHDFLDVICERCFKIY